MTQIQDSESLCIRQLNDGASYEFVDAVAVESAARILLNEEEVATLACSPSNLVYLALGFLVSEGIVSDPKRIKRVSVSDSAMPIDVNVVTDLPLPFRLPATKLQIPSGCGKGSFFANRGFEMPGRVRNNIIVSYARILQLMQAFQKASGLYRETGGVHGAALSDGKELIVFMEDLSRHNAVDKVFGFCLSQKRPLASRVLLTTGRISSDLVLKAARMALPIVVSRSAPTALAVKLACNLGLTLVGFARGRRMNIYTHAQRINGGKSG